MPFAVQVGRSIGQDGGVPGSGGWLRVEPDQLDGAIAVFQDALHVLEHEVGVAIRGIEAKSPAADVASRQAVEVFNRRAYRDADSAISAWRAAVGELRRIVDQLMAAKLAIATADTSNATSFQAPR